MNNKNTARLRKIEKMDSHFNELDLLDDSAEQSQQQARSNLPGKPRGNSERKKNFRSTAKNKRRNIQKRK